MGIVSWGGAGRWQRTFFVFFSSPALLSLLGQGKEKGRRRKKRRSLSCSQGQPPGGVKGAGLAGEGL